jgi:hypothetical protein
MAALQTEIEKARPEAAAQIGGAENPRAASTVQDCSLQGARVGKSEMISSA